MILESKLKVLFLTEIGIGYIGLAIVNGLKDLGCEVAVRSRYDAAAIDLSKEPFDLVCTDGPHYAVDGQTGMLELAKLLKRYPSTKRPFFVWFLYENTLNMSLPLWLHRLATVTRWRLDRLLENPYFPGLRSTVLATGHRARILAEVQYFQAQGLVDLLATNSSKRVGFLKKLGIESEFVPLGYDPVYGEDRKRERDIDVVFLGLLGKKRRRRRLLQIIKNDLKSYGIDLTIVSGKKHDNNQRVGGEERTELLNRTRIMINVLASQTDMTGERLLMAMANGALVISEPMSEAAPFVPDQHFVVAEPNRIAEKIAHYLRCEQERAAITERAYKFVTEKLTMRAQCEGILTRYQDSLILRESLSASIANPQTSREIKWASRTILF